MWHAKCIQQIGYSFARIHIVSCIMHCYFGFKSHLGHSCRILGKRVMELKRYRTHPQPTHPPPMPCLPIYYILCAGQHSVVIELTSLSSKIWEESRQQISDVFHKVLLDHINWHFSNELLFSYLFSDTGRVIRYEFPGE